MARPIYSHEMTDPDFQWLIKNYMEKSAPVAVVDSGCLPLVMVLLDENARSLVNQDIISHNILGTIANPADDTAALDDPKKNS